MHGSVKKNLFLWITPKICEITVVAWFAPWCKEAKSSLRFGVHNASWTWISWFICWKWLFWETPITSFYLDWQEQSWVPFENYTLYTFYDVPNTLPPFGLSDHDTVAVQPLARQNLPKKKILLKSRDLRATNRMVMRTYLEEVNLGLLIGLKESCEEKTRTLETIIKTGMDTLLRPKSKTVIANEPP